MSGEYAGPDRRAQAVALADAVDSLDKKVGENTEESTLLRREVARERLWRRGLTLVVVLTLALMVSVWVFAVENRRTINRVTGPEAREMQNEQIALLVCGINSWSSHVAGAEPPPCATATTIP